MRRLQPLAIAAAVAAASGCAHVPLTTDTRLKFLSPERGSEVTLPVTVAWHLRDPGQARSYAVYVDGTPVGPRGRVARLSGAPCPRRVRPTDLQCLAYLRQNGVYLTVAPALTITDIAPRTGDFTAKQLHDITVVLVDADGRRLGESSWTLQVHVKTRSS